MRDPAAGTILGLVLAGLSPTLAWGLELYPKQLDLPKELVPENIDALVVESYGMADFEDGKGNTTRVEGRRVYGNLMLRPDPRWDGEKTWMSFEKRLTDAGWKIVSARDLGRYVVVFNHPQGVWCRYAGRASDELELECVEKGGPQLKLDLPIPGPKPERQNDDADAPWLRHFPGSELSTSAREDGPFDVASEGEPVLVGRESTVRNYEGPNGLSNIQLIAVYKAALIQAGWKILHESEPKAQEGLLLAQYRKNSRDLWAQFRVSSGGYSVRSADVGASLNPEILKRELNTTCRSTIYGLRFDTKSGVSVRPESIPILERIGELLSENPELELELGGHIDATGTKEARAKLSAEQMGAAKAWLLAHGIADRRLTIKGYGDSVPVESNDSPEGRALNRRLVLGKKGCVR